MNDRDIALGCVFLGIGILGSIGLLVVFLYKSRIQMPIKYPKLIISCVSMCVILALVGILFLSSVLKIT